MGKHACEHEQGKKRICEANHLWLSRGKVLLGECTLVSFAVLRKRGMFLFSGDTMEFYLV